MKKVMIVGAGAHECGRFEGKPFTEIGRVAVQRALDDAGMEFKDIQGAFCSRVFLPQCSGLKVLTQFGRTGIPVVDIEAACAASGACLRQAYNAIVSGQYDIVLAFGVEKVGRGFLPAPNYAEWQVRMGLCQNPQYWSMNARRHMYDYGTTIEQIAQVAVKNHKYGALNPYAMYRKEMTIDEILNSPMVCDPMTLFMVCAPNEGSAAMILCSEEFAKKYNKSKPVNIAACEHRICKHPLVQVAAQYFYPFDNPPATTEASMAAYEAAGIGPDDVDVAEVQDTDAFCEIEAIEQLGFCEKGEGGRFTEEGATEIDGKIPVNISGGLISNGEPVGASGMRQVFEIVCQLRGNSGARQVEGAKVGLTHVYGADGHCAVVILNC
ncbi:MAG: thiolase family protein [Syntrophaceae bacterium]|nr:thiolase family protein [Syntrophaceae bacterium]